MGSLMFGDINQFFGEYLKEYKLEDFVIVVTGREIITSIKQKAKTLSSGSFNSYQSKYKNIVFAPRIAPSPVVEESFYSNIQSKFEAAYKEELTIKEVMSDLCAIVDMVVNKNKNVVLLCSKRESYMEFFEYMREFIMENFKLYMISIGEALVDHDLLYQYGNDDEIRTMLAFNIKYYKIVDETFNDFINRFIDDEAEKYKEMLMNKTVDELAAIGSKYSLHINKYKPKELIVEHILKRIMEK